MATNSVTVSEKMTSSEAEDDTSATVLRLKEHEPLTEILDQIPHKVCDTMTRGSLLITTSSRLIYSLNPLVAVFV